MHFELEQEVMEQPAAAVTEPAPMETDAESSSTAGITALMATQARVSEGRTLAAPASEGRTLTGQIEAPVRKRRKRWAQRKRCTV